MSHTENVPGQDSTPSAATLAEVLATGNTANGNSIVLDDISQITAAGSTHTTQTPIDLNLPDLTGAGGVHINSNSPSTSSRSLLKVRQLDTGSSNCATVCEFVQQSVGKPLMSLIGNGHVAIEWSGNANFDAGPAPFFGTGAQSVDQTGIPRWRSSRFLGAALPLLNSTHYSFGNDMYAARACQVG